jgi:soluble lytic murein transglycosylase-like protein
MSVESIGERIAAIQSKIEAITGGPQPAAAPGFDEALNTASTAAAAPATAPTATAAAATPAAGAGLGGAPTPYDGMIQAAAAKYGLDPALLKALIRQESNFDPNAGSPAGAQGLTQLMPGTAASLGVTNPKDPAQAIEGGAKYLRQQLDAFGGDVRKALAAYNAGPGAVQRHGGIPPYPETQNYVQKVLAYAAEYRGTPGTAAPAGPAAAATATTTAALAAPAPAAAASLSSLLPATPVATSPNQFGIV